VATKYSSSPQTSPATRHYSTVAAKKRRHTDPANPPVCMVMSAAKNICPAHAVLQTSLREIRADMRMAIERKIAEGMCNGELPPNIDALALAHFYAAHPGHIEFSFQAAFRLAKYGGEAAGRRLQYSANWVRQ
jgi:hypothetical protein